MRAFFEAFPSVHGFYLIEDALDEDFVGFWALADCHQGFVYLFGPLEVRMDHVFVLVEGSTDHKQPKQPKEQLTPLRLVEHTEPFTIFHHQALPNLITDLDLLIIIRHHLRDVPLPHNL